MRTSVLVKRSLVYFWRTNVAVVSGVAIAVAVLAGALLVGDSVRASLRDLFLSRLGRADHVVSAAGFFRERLADELQADERFGANGFEAACPLVVLEGGVTHERSGRRAAGVQVYGVDERFWKFHGAGDGGAAPREREILLSAGLAGELGAETADVVLLRVEKPSAIPAESLHGRRDDLGRTVRLNVRGSLAADALGEFSVRPQQSAVRAVFVPLRLLQRDLAQEGRVNTILLSAKQTGDATPDAGDTTKTALLETILRERIALEDLGVALRSLDAQRGIALENESALLTDALAETAQAAAVKQNMRAAPVLSYLANSIRAGGRDVPYSLVAAVDEVSFEDLKQAASASNSSTASTSTTSTSLPASSSLPASTSSNASGASSSSTRPDESSNSSGTSSKTLAPILLNDWAARDLGVKTGDVVTLEYYLWQEGESLLTRAAEFRLAGVVPIAGAAADRDLVPNYPGITEAQSVAEWDPPFPVDLARIRPRDEDYWDEFRTTPKAFVPLAKGQELWQSRFGRITSVRIVPPRGAPLDETLDLYGKSLRAAIDPAVMGLAVYPARARGLEASRGATDFGEYFLYFSFFLIVSALMLTALFFKLGVEQRLREIGILRATGFPAARIRTLFLSEAVVLATVGSLLGLAGAVLYGKLMMHGLRTWWVGAVGTTMLALHVAPSSLVIGGLGGVVAGLACIVWTLRKLAPSSPRSLLTGVLDEGQKEKGRTQKEHQRGASSRLRFSLFNFLPRLSSSRAAVVFGLLGSSLVLAAAFDLTGQAAGFFGGGTLLLVALLCGQSAWLRRGARRAIAGRGWASVSRLGFRNATHRPGRSVLCIALIASAAFIVVAVDAFRREGGGDVDAVRERRSGSGGYPLLAESVLPLVHDPNTAQGRESLNFISGEDAATLDGVSFARFRVRPGDDASCLNLYEPRDPRILAPVDDFVRSGRFAFQSSLAQTSEKKANPWLLLNGDVTDGAIPVIADANSMTYVLHLKLGDEFVLNRTGDAGAVRLRLVGALSDSIFQGEFLMSEKNFMRLFPEHEGYRFFLLDVSTPLRSNAVAAVLEERLADFGFDVAPTQERLANFHRVENTFLSTFQMLGGLGLALGTLGLAAVLLRNVLERRRELALLRAVGYGRAHFALMAIAENALLLFCGLATGTLCALLAITPVILARGGQLPVASLGSLLLAVLVSGLAASLLATAAALRSPLLPALRAE